MLLSRMVPAERPLSLQHAATYGKHEYLLLERGVSTFFRSVFQIKDNYNYKSVAFVVLPVVLLSCHMLPSFGRSRFTDIPDNKYQHHVFDLLSVLTNTSDPVYDNSGSYVSRPHAYYIYFTSVLMRTKWMHDQLIREIPDSIRKTKCTVFIKDERTRTLPEDLISWLEDHFLPYNKDIYIWGRKYNTGDLGTVDSTFEAVRSARYFLSPPDVLHNGRLLLNGEEIRKQIFTLEKGENSISFEGEKNTELEFSRFSVTTVLLKHHFLQIRTGHFCIYPLLGSLSINHTTVCLG